MPRPHVAVVVVALGIVAFGITAANGDGASCETDTPVGEGGGSSCGCGAALSRENGEGAAKYSERVVVPAEGHGETDEEAALVFMEGGSFTMGSDKGFFPEDGEDARDVTVSPFYLSKYEVSVLRFEKFVNATGYVTEAEKFGNSFVVEQFISKKVSKGITNAVAAAPWWLPVDGCDWRHPEGPDTNVKSRMSHPVNHVSWNDAVAFCRWSHPRGRLPTEAEWEFGARGGLKNREFPWGAKETPGGKRRMNTWQSVYKPPSADANVFKHSSLPVQDGHRYYSAKNSKEDGWETTAPVDEYEPNKYGLYNTVGNVWEWTNDWHARDRSGYPSVDPQGAVEGTNKVKKGGSFMCNPFTCYRFRVAARMMVTPDSSAQNIGFRCAASVDPEA